MSLITLTSDIGHQDYLVSAIKGQLLQLDPTFTILDVTHGITPFNYPQAAYICSSAFKNFPAHSFHIVLVNLFDRKPERLLLAFHNDQYILCADNGLITMICGGKPDLVIGLPLTNGGVTSSNKAGATANAGTTGPGMTNSTSNTAATTTGMTSSIANAPATIPGMVNTATVPPKIDTSPRTTLFCTKIMGQAVKRLQDGDRISDIGIEDIEIEVKNPMRPRITENFIEGQIIFIDHFENVIVNITREEFEETRKNRDFQIVFRHDDKIEKISEHYSSVPEGEKLALFNSAGYLELAINKGNAAGLLGLSGFTEKSQRAQNRLIYQLVKIDFF